jgi:hypothetical protein
METEQKYKRDKGKEKRVHIKIIISRLISMVLSLVVLQDSDFRN